MNLKNDYHFAQGSLLDSPNTYFYSTYGGAAFVQAWHRDRGLCRSKLVKGASQHAIPCTGATADHLRRWAAQLSASGLTTEERQLLDMMLRNFEAKKRLYEDYFPGFNSKGRLDYFAICIYVKFAEVLVLACQRWQSLPYLNALLKCVDILCAEQDRLAGGDKARVAAVIEAEAKFVAELAEKMGVVL